MSNVLDQWTSDGAHYRVVAGPLPRVELWGEQLNYGSGLAVGQLPLSDPRGRWHRAEIRGADAEAVVARLAVLAGLAGDAFERTSEVAP